jgi:hypothetical protein
MSQLHTLRLSGGSNDPATLPQELGYLGVLRELSLFDMMVKGTLAASIVTSDLLVKLQLHNIAFTDGLAQLPAEWSNLHVTQLELVNVTGLIGSIPSTWSASGGFPRLQNLTVQLVSGLTATLDEWWSFISRPGAPAQQRVLLNDNSMQSTLPAGILDANR